MFTGRQPLALVVEGTGGLETSHLLLHHVRRPLSIDSVSDRGKMLGDEPAFSGLTLSPLTGSGGLTRVGGLST